MSVETRSETEPSQESESDDPLMASPVDICLLVHDKPRFDVSPSKKRHLESSLIPLSSESFQDLPSPPLCLRTLPFSSYLSSPSSSLLSLSHSPARPSWIMDNLSKESILSYLSSLSLRRLQNALLPILNILLNHKDNKDVFNSPVDVVKLKIPDYLEIVQHPMDLGTIRGRLNSGYYTSPVPFIQDIRTVFLNAMKYNPTAHPVHQLASRMLSLFESEMKRLVVRLRQMDKQSEGHSCLLCNNRTCVLCGEKCLRYSPPVVYCDGPCKKRIIQNSSYYILRGKSGRWCLKCLSKVVSGLLPKESRKDLIVKVRNDRIQGEPWIQCSVCSKWMHQVCGLFNPFESSKGTYRCPLCLLDDPDRPLSHAPEYGSNGNGNGNGRPRDTGSLFLLPTTPISDYLERYVRNKVESAYCKHSQDGIPLPTLLNSLHIRLVSSLIEDIEIIPQLRQFYEPYGITSVSSRSKVIVLFQRCQDIDVLLFTMYVREFDSTAQGPNQNCVYISYLDSVHYLKPNYLRTTVYHSILTSYIGYVQQQGFTSVRIWTCPPTRGDDYIFYDHPKEQRTPTPQRLLNWYQEMLKSSREQGFVHSVSNMYEMMREALSWPLAVGEQAKCRSQEEVALRKVMRMIPYFDGDFWPLVEGQIVTELTEGKSSGSGASSGFLSSSSSSSCSSVCSASTSSSRSASIMSSPSSLLEPTTPSSPPSPNSSVSSPSLTGLCTRSPSPRSSCCDTPPALSSSSDIFSSLDADIALVLSSSLYPFQATRSHSDGHRSRSRSSSSSSSSASYSSSTHAHTHTHTHRSSFEGSISSSSSSSSMAMEDSMVSPATRSYSSHSSSSGSHRVTESIDPCMQRLPLALRKFAERILSMKERFIVAHLVPYCSACGVYIRSGVSYTCTVCTSSSSKETVFCSSCRLQHPHNRMIERSYNYQPKTDENPIIRSPILDNRYTFLRVCQGRHMQFDTQRRAIYSSSLLLYLLSVERGQRYTETCDRCFLAIDPGNCWECCQCLDYTMCPDCHKAEGHEHTMTLKS